MMLRALIFAPCSRRFFIIALSAESLCSVITLGFCTARYSSDLRSFRSTNRCSRSINRYLHLHDNVAAYRNKS
ncbi:hypothetical protein F4678DRAFT_439626 [Xylaria arbuscula]|nr:hypothetical protein F4678DRAFT_439626 [Xylaria arbuscula]